MRTSGVRLGRVFDIEISADLGVVMFAGLLTWILASSILPASVAGLPAGAYWSVAALGTLLFLGSLLAHELGTPWWPAATTSRCSESPSGCSAAWPQLRSDARTAGAELRIALAGPAMSLVVGALSPAAAVGLRSVGVPRSTSSRWAGWVSSTSCSPCSTCCPVLRSTAVGCWAADDLDGPRRSPPGQVWAARAGRAVAILIVAAGAAEVFVLRSSSGLWTIAWSAGS